MSILLFSYKVHFGFISSHYIICTLQEYSFGIHVFIDKYTNLFFFAWQVEVSTSSLDPTFSFVLDAGLKMFIWSGARVSVWLLLIFKLFVSQPWMIICKIPWRYCCVPIFEGDLPDLRTVLFYLICESRLTKRVHLLFYLQGKRNNENKRKVIESDGIIFGYFIICVAHISGKYRVNWWMLCLSTWSHNRLFAEKLNKNDRKNKAEIIMCETVGAKC